MRRLMRLMLGPRYCVSGQCLSAELLRQDLRDDGCGGSCGSCEQVRAVTAVSAPAPQTAQARPAGMTAAAAPVVPVPRARAVTAVSAAVPPDCSGKSCGSDGCGGSCGSCSSGLGWTAPANACTVEECPALPSPNGIILYAAPGEQYCYSSTQYATCVAGTGGACPQWDLSGDCQSLFRPRSASPSRMGPSPTALRPRVLSR